MSCSTIRTFSSFAGVFSLTRRETVANEKRCLSRNHRDVSLRISFSRVSFEGHQRKNKKEKKKETRTCSSREGRAVNTSFPIYAVTRAKNAIVGAAPRDAITGGIPGTRSLIPTSPHAADTPCLCTKTTPLSLGGRTSPGGRRHG